MGGDDGLSEALLLGGVGQASCWSVGAAPALAYVLTSPSCALVTPPFLPFHFLQLMSVTSAPNDVPWTPGDKAEARCCLALWAGPAGPFPP